VRDYVKKGSKLYVEGRIQTRSWDDKDNQKHYKTEIVINELVPVSYTHLFADVDKARESLLAAHDPQSQIRANGQLDGALGRLLAIAENYPNLKANENFLQLQDSLEGTENRIAVERRRYNETLQDYNTFIGQIPNNVWAHFAGFKPNTAYFEASPASQAAPQVHF